MRRQDIYDRWVFMFNIIGTVLSPEELAPDPNARPPMRREAMLRSRGHQEVPLQRRRSTTRTPRTEHGVVHRNHHKARNQP